MPQRSEPHKISAPPPYYPRAVVNGVVHETWRAEATHLQMGCGFATREWTLLEGNVAVTCVWCLVHHLPWLRWTTYELGEYGTCLEYVTEAGSG